MSLETPLHRVEGLGSSHTGVQQFWRLRVSGVVLAFLTIWFAYVVLGLVGATEAGVLFFLQKPLNTVLMGTFVVLCSYHMALGIREVIDDYVHSNGFKIFLQLVNWTFAFAVAAASVLALLKIAL